MRLINCIFALSSGGSTLRVSAHNRKRNRNRMGEEANFKYASINSIKRKRECDSSEMHNLASWKREMHCCSKWEFWSLWGWWACYFPTSPIWFICTSADLSGALVSCRKLGICQVWTGLSSSTFYYFFFFCILPLKKASCLLWAGTSCQREFSVYSNIFRRPSNFICYGVKQHLDTESISIIEGDDWGVDWAPEKWEN